MIYLDMILALVALSAAFLAMNVKNLLSSIMLSAVVSLTVSVFFLRMAAPDVAMTEAAIGAGLTTIIFLIATARTKECDQ